MKVVYSLDELPHGLPRPVATIGNFDGIHLGHQVLMKQLVQRAHAVDGTPAIVTFHPHPLQVLAPNNAPRQIQTLAQKVSTLQSLGIGLVVVIPFSREFAQIKARDFAVSILWGKLELSEIYVGPNFAFGHRREGSFSLLREIGEEKGFLVGKIPQVQFRGSRVSSTAIRQALLSGLVALARRLLARPYALDGAIVHGAAKGAGLSVPTANLQTANELIPRSGVYVTYLRIEGERCPSVTNIGFRPTLAEENPDLTIETHMLDQNRDLYGAEVGVEFLLRLRDERKFPGPEALVAQIRKDVARARRFFGRLSAVVPPPYHSDFARGSDVD